MSVQGIIGKKVGMTQVYAEDGRAIPVTVIEAGPCVVVQRKSEGRRTATRRCSSAWSRSAQGQARHRSP